MSNAKNQTQASPGFALLVVLSTLAILTLLFAISSKLSLTHLRFQSTEITLAQTSFQKAEILKAVADREPADFQTDRTLQAQIGSEVFTVSLVDVGGLVDLNSAAPALLSSFFEALELSQDDLATYRAWRQQSRRLLHVDDLARILDKPIDLPILRRTATVYSGRSGVAPEETPDELSNLLSQKMDIDAFVSPASGVSYIIQVGDSVLGALNFPPTGKAKILSLN